MRGLLGTPEVYRVGCVCFAQSAASSAGIFIKSLCSGCAAVRCETLGQAKLITEYPRTPRPFLPLEPRVTDTFSNRQNRTFS